MILTENDIRVLSYMRQHSPITVEDLALDLAFSKSRMYYLLQDLISHGLVHKRILSARKVTYSVVADEVLQSYLNAQISELQRSLLDQSSTSGDDKQTLVLSDSYMLDPKFLAELETKFHVVTFPSSPRFLSDDLFIERCKDAHIIVNFFSIYISEKLLKKCPKLHTIALPTISTSSVDMKACKKRGIRVLCLTKSPSYKRGALPEFAITQLLALFRHISPAAEAVQEGKVDFHGFLGEEIRGKKVGIVGTGEHALLLHGILHAFGAEVMISNYHTTRLTDASDFSQASYYSLEHLFQTCDVLIFPEDYKPVIKLDRYLQTPFSVKYIIFLSSEVIYSPHILRELLRAGRLTGVAIDYFPEVLHEESDILHSNYRHLLGLPNVIITPEIGFYTRESMLRNQRALMDILRGL